MRLLFVCTANRSRSPAAAALWRRELERRGVPAHASADEASSDDASAGVESAGVMAREGELPVSAMAWAAALHGVRLGDHRSRMLDAETVARADLILTMTREQADQVGMTHARVGDRLFLLGELAALLRLRVRVPLDDDVPLEHDAPVPRASSTPAAAAGTLVTVDRFATTLATARARRVLRGLVDDDIAEPGVDRDRTTATLERIAIDLRTIADALIGPPVA